jgi:2-dehydro-3-deoxygluconokinase
VRVSLDVNLRRRLWSDAEAAPVLQELAELCDLVIAGEDEATLLCGSADPAVLAERFGVEAVVKRGARGAAAWREGEAAEDAGIAVAAVDVIGAGDAFTAGYLDALLDGAALGESLRRANACGAVSVTAVGDATGLPTRSELQRVLAGGGDVVR